MNGHGHIIPSNLWWTSYSDNDIVRGMDFERKGKDEIPAPVRGIRRRTSCYGGRGGPRNMCFCETNPNCPRRVSSVSGTSTVSYNFGAHFSIRVRLDGFSQFDGRRSTTAKDRQQH